MTIRIKMGNIVDEEVCAVVNAANSTLLGGGGVDGAIHMAGGPEILEECRKIREEIYPRGLPAGKAVVTGAGRMRARYVIHTVGPIYPQCKGECEELLRDAYTNSMVKALELGCDSIAFPAISTGAYGYPPEEAAKIAYKAVKSFQKEEIEVRFLFRSLQSMKIFEASIS